MLGSIIDVGKKILDFIPDVSKKKELEIELNKVVSEAESKMQEEMTKRWESDNETNSWLTKNVRPVMFLSAFLFFAVLSLMKYDETYVRMSFNFLTTMAGLYIPMRTLDKWRK